MWAGLNAALNLAGWAGLQGCMRRHAVLTICTVVCWQKLLQQELLDVLHMQDIHMMHSVPEPPKACQALHVAAGALGAPPHVDRNAGGRAAHAVPPTLWDEERITRLHAQLQTHQSCRSAGSWEAQKGLQPPKGILSRSLAAKVQRPKNTSMSGLLLSKVAVRIKQLIAAGDAQCGALLRVQFARKSGLPFG